MKTGERIKTIRKSQGITQAKLAETLHISSSFMSRIENGSSSLTLDFVCEIADALQVTRQEVLRDVFTYTKDDSIPISKKIEINIQKFSPEKQAEILDVLEFLASRLSYNTHIIFCIFLDITDMFLGHEFFIYTCTLLSIHRVHVFLSG